MAAQSTVIKFSKKYADFDAYFLAFLQYLAFNYERLKVDGQKVFELSQSRDAWLEAYGKYKTPSTHTREAVIAAENAHKASFKLVSEVRQQIKNNSEVTLTETDHAELGIILKKEHRTKTQPPEYAPVLVEVLTKRLVNTFTASYPDSAGTRRTAMPARNTKLRAYVAYAPAGSPEPKAKDFKAVLETGRSKFTVQSPDGTPAGTRGFVQAAYFNLKGEGEKSAPLQFFVI